MSDPTERRGREIVVHCWATDDQAEALFDAILHVADLVDPGQCAVSLGPSPDLDEPDTEEAPNE